MNFLNDLQNLFPAKNATPKAVSAAELSKILQLPDSIRLVLATHKRICQKSDCGEHMDRLSYEEQVICICIFLKGEVDNGGFDQFLFNSSGNHAHRVEECLHAIGADKTAEICHKAFAAYGKPIPQDRITRQRFMDEMECDRIADTLSECDEEFYKCPDNLDELCFQYILANKEKFS